MSTLKYLQLLEMYLVKHLCLLLKLQEKRLYYYDMIVKNDNFSCFQYCYCTLLWVHIDTWCLTQDEHHHHLSESDMNLSFVHPLAKHMCIDLYVPRWFFNSFHVSSHNRISLKASLSHCYPICCYPFKFYCSFFLLHP